MKSFAQAKFPLSLELPWSYSSLTCTPSSSMEESQGKQGYLSQFSYFSTLKMKLNVARS